MSDEDAKLLQAVRDWRPPEKLHPIAMRAWHIYEGHRNSLPPDAMAELKAILDNYGDDLQGLAEAFEGLTRFVIYVTEHLKDKTSGDKVVELMRTYTHLYEPFWERVGEALQNVGAEARGSFQQFTDKVTGAEKTAPTYGQAPPKNTVPLRNLVSPTRPPPWANKNTGKK